MKRKFSILIITMSFCSLAWTQSTPADNTAPSADKKMQRHIEIKKDIVGGMEQRHEGMGYDQGRGQGFGRGMGRGRGAGFGGGRDREHRGGPMGAMRWWKNAEMVKHINLTEAQ